MTACEKCGSPTRVEFHSTGDFIVCTRSDELVEDCPGERRKAERRAPSEDALDAMLGLHEGIEVIYVVDGYEASLTGHDGATTVLHARGDTVVGALRALAAAYADSKP